MRVLWHYLIHVYFMLTTYRRGLRRVYPVILPPHRVSQETRCIQHRMMCTSRRLGGLSMWGGFGRLGRMSLQFVGRVSLTGLAHRGLHQRALPGLWLNMLGRWRICGRSYVPREREKWHPRAAHATVRGIHVLYGSITWHSRCSAVFTCKRR
jgi:hypothetical protein